MSCIEADRVDEYIELVKKVCGERKTISVDMPVTFPQAQVNFATVPKKIDIGGATIIVQDVEKYLKLNLFLIMMEKLVSILIIKNRKKERYDEKRMNESE